MNIFKSDRTWAILTMFLEDPKKGRYVNQIARESNVSAASVSRICRELANEKILKREEKANIVIYSLIEDDAFIKRLKSAHSVYKIRTISECYTKEEFQTVALYGSHASGDYDETSDFDFLVITNMGKKKVAGLLQPLSELGEFNVTVYSIGEWRKLSLDRDPFYESVVKNSIVLHGGSL